MPFWLIPLVILGAILVVFGILVFLGRFRKGRYLKPLITGLSKIPFVRRLLEKASTAALERQNPELASAMRKLQRLGPSTDLQKQQRAIQAMPVNEQRALMEHAEQMREMSDEPEMMNRQLRRLQQRQYGQPKATASRPPRKRKKR